ncbi:MAG: hypothetical protein R3B95_06545 [Nitrospirales bacterium]|nr:hypothetical protein [Nitrospirales bacterium]
MGSVIQTHTHQSNGLHHPQPFLQTPVKQVTIACGNQKSRTRKTGSRPDKRLQAFMILGNGMPEKTNLSGISGNAALAFDYGRHLLDDGIRQLGFPIVAMDLKTQPIATRQIPFDSQTNRVAGYRETQGRTLDCRKRFAGVEPQLGIER